MGNIIEILKARKLFIPVIIISLLIIILTLALLTRELTRDKTSCSLASCPTGCCVNNLCLPKNYSSNNYSCVGGDKWSSATGEIITQLPEEIINQIKNDISATGAISNVNIPVPTITEGKEKIQSIVFDKQKISDIPIEVMKNQTDKLWIGSYVNGLYVYSNGTISEVYGGVQVYSLLPYNNLIYIGFTKNKRKPVTEVRGTSGDLRVTFDRPVYMEEDQEYGFGQWDGVKLKNISQVNLPWNFAETEDGKIFFSSNNGVFVYENNLIRQLGLKDTLTFGLLHDQDKLFIGAKGGIWKYESGQFNKILDLPNHKILSLIKDNDGNYFAAATSGLFKSENGINWHQIGSDISLKSLASTPDNKIFAAGSPGLFYISNNMLVEVLKDIHITAINWFDNSLFIGTLEGLYSYKIAQ